MRVLIITPTPTHPATAGNRKMVQHLASFFIGEGYEVSCFYIPFESYDHKAMNLFFEGNLVVANENTMFAPQSRFNHLRHRANLKVFGLTKKLSYIAGATAKDSFEYNSHVDQHISLNVRVDLQKMIAGKHFDVVVCEYVWTSSLLSLFNKNTFKIIDTHDCFSDRHKIYQKINRRPEWISLYPKQEAKGLKRADLIIALNEKEREYFERISGKKSILYGYVPKINQIFRPRFENKLLYFASSNDINQISINWFIDEVFPKIKLTNPNIQLLVGGRISSKLKVVDSSIKLLGEFVNPTDFYKLGDIVINPEKGGTGLKIKALEALSLGLPLIATNAGAAGVTDEKNEHLVLADDVNSFVQSINVLSINEHFRRILAHNSTEWIRSYNSRLTRNLRENLPK